MEPSRDGASVEEVSLGFIADFCLLPASDWGTVGNRITHVLAKVGRTLKL